MQGNIVGISGAVIGGILALLTVTICIYLWHKKRHSEVFRKLIVKFPLPFTREKKDERRLKRKKAVKKKSTAVPPKYSSLIEKEDELTTESDSASSSHSFPLQSPTDHKPCLLHFSLFYNFHDSHLFVNIISVDNIPQKKFGRLPSSFVKLQLSSDRARPCQTEVHTSNLNPVFRESFEFIGYSYNEITNLTLLTSLFVCDRFSQEHLIGQTSLALNEVDWKPTYPVQFCREIVTKRRASSCSSCPESKGELFLSLRYQARANRIAVVVLKALGLSKSSKILSTDPFITITLKCDGQIVETKQTKKKKRTVNPVWNQSFLFDINKDLIDKYELTFDVLDYDLIFPCSPLGQITISPNASGTGKIHWDNMMSKKDSRSEVAMSHML